MAPKNTRIGTGIDPGSAILGAAAAIALLAIAWFALSYSQNAGTAPEQPAAATPAVEVIGNSRLPSTFQVVVKSNERQNVRIQGFTIGGSNYNLTANLSPGEIKSFSVAPPDCTSQQEYNCNVIIRYVLSDGTGSTASQNATGTGQEPEESGNESGQGASAPVPLSILTAEMPSGTEDLEYGLSLEAEGGSGSYSWQVAGLPLELTASSNGRITGQALEAGTFTVHVTVSDGSSSVERDLQLVINANPD